MKFVLVTLFLFSSILLSAQSASDTGKAEFLSPTELIQSYIHTLSLIDDPLKMYEKEYVTNIFKHYNNLLIAEIFYKSHHGDKESEIAENVYLANEQALTVAENFISLLRLNNIDPATLVIKDVNLTEDKSPEIPDNVIIAWAEVTVEDEGNIHILKAPVVKEEIQWHLIGGPMSWNGEVIFSLMSRDAEEHEDWDDNPEVDFLEEDSINSFEIIEINWALSMGHRNCDTLYYLTKVDAAFIDSVSSSLIQSEQFQMLDKKSKVQLLIELDALKNETWDDFLFQRSKGVELDEVKTIFKRTRSHKVISEVYECSVVYYFSKPICIYGKNICLFLEQQYFPDNTTSIANFYQKDANGFWQELESVYFWH